MISGCPKIDAMAMIKNIVAEAGHIKSIGLRDVNITASVEILRSLKATNAFGLDENGSKTLPPTKPLKVSANNAPASQVVGYWQS